MENAMAAPAVPLKTLFNKHRRPFGDPVAYVHNYQRFTRRVGRVTTPYIIQGAGGYAHDRRSMHKLQRDAGGQIRTPFKTTRTDVILDAYNEDDPGFLRLTVDGSELVCEYFLVPFDAPPSGQPFDSIAVNWRSHTVSSSIRGGSGPARGRKRPR